MASSYSTNFKIEKMATGDQSGTWGTTTNHNFDILDRIAAFKAVALSDASTATLTVAASSPSSGSSNVQDGMFRVIKFTGSLSQACTITIAPSTTTAYFIIENGTSGSQNIIMKQGSGAQTVTIAPAKSDIIYCDASDEVISVGTKIGLSVALDDIATTILQPDTAKSIVKALATGAAAIDLTMGVLYAKFLQGDISVDNLLLLAEPTTYIIMALGEEANIKYNIEGNDLDELDFDDNKEKFESQVNEFKNAISNVKNITKKKINTSTINEQIVPRSILEKVKETSSKIRENLLDKGEK